jgi:hypothetical protein
MTDDEDADSYFVTTGTGGILDVRVQVAKKKGKEAYNTGFQASELC